MYVVVDAGRVIFSSNNLWACRGYRDGHGSGKIKKVLTKAQGNTSRTTYRRYPELVENAKDA